MQPIEFTTPTRRAAVYGLAGVGFVALIAFGIWLAIYSSRYVPEVVNTLGSAAVSLSELFTPAPEPSLLVVGSSTPATSTTISFGDDEPAVTTPANTGTRPSGGSTTPGPETGGTFPIGTTTPVLHGLPDLVVEIDAIGYLASGSTDSFVASSTVPAGSRAAVKFIIRNAGTNVAAPWRWSATLPAQGTFGYQSQLQQSLNPGDRIEFTLGFDQPNRGSNQTITINVNHDSTIGESNTNNNRATATLTVQ